METSNLIALGALIVAVIGLVPTFLQVFNKRKSEGHNFTNNKLTASSKSKEVSGNMKSKDVKETGETKVPMPFMLRILMLVVFAIASFLIEIILFGIIAHFCGVEVNLETMTLLWKVIFYSLFFILGIFLFLVLLTLSANLTD